MILHYPPFGYLLSENRRKLIIHDEIAIYVKKIFEMANNKHTSVEIAKYLNAHFIPTKSDILIRLGYRKKFNFVNDKAHWIAASVSSILNDERYIGNTVQGKSEYLLDENGVRKNKAIAKSTWIITKNTHEAIIEKQLFYQVKHRNKNTEENKARVFKEILKCGHCGFSLIRRFPKTRPMYSCPTIRVTDFYGCEAFNMLESELENIIITSFKQHVSIAVDLKDLLKIERESKYKLLAEQKLLLHAVETEIQKKRDEFTNLYISYSSASITQDEFMMKKLENEKEINNKLAHAREIEQEMGVIGEKAKINDEEFEALEEINSISKLQVKDILRAVDKIVVVNSQDVRIEWKVKF